MGTLPLLIPLLLFQEAGQKDFERRFRMAADRIADDHVRLGRYLDRSLMHRWGLQQAFRALRLNPDHPAARKRLGYVDRDGVWVRDGSIRVESRNKRTSGIDEIRTELHSREKRIAARAARQLARLARWAASRKLESRARKCWKIVLEYDRSNAEALKALGWIKAGEVWLPPNQIELDRKFRDGLDRVPSGRAVDAESMVEKRLGIHTTKRAAPHFQIEASAEAEVDLARCTRLAERTFAVYHELLSPDKTVLGGRIRIILLRSQAEHAAFIDSFEPGSEREREQSKRNEGAMYLDPPVAEAVQRDKEVAFLYDYTIHATCHILLALHVGVERPWLTEGLAYAFTRRITRTALTACVNLAGTTREGAKSFSDPMEWPKIVRHWVTFGGDPGFSEVFASGLNELDQERAIKAWSLIEYLLAEHRKRLPALVAALKRAPSKETWKAFEEVLGLDRVMLEVQWRAFVRRTF